MLFRSLAGMTLLAAAQFAAPSSAQAQEVWPLLQGQSGFSLTAAAVPPRAAPRADEAPLPRSFREVKADDADVPTAIEWTTANGGKVKLRPMRVRLSWGF